MMPLHQVFRHLKHSRICHIPYPLPPGNNVTREEVRMLAPLIPKLTVKLLQWHPNPPEMVLQFIESGVTSKPIRLRLSAVVFDRTEDLVAFGTEMIRKHPVDGKVTPLLAIDGTPNRNGKKP